MTDKEWAELLCWLETKQSSDSDKNHLDLIVVGKSLNVWHGCD